MNRRRFLKSGLLFVPAAFAIVRPTLAQIVNATLRNATIQNAATIAGGSTLNNGIVAYWKLNESSGSRADSVGSETLTDHNGTSGGTLFGTAASNFTASSTQYLGHADDATLSLGANTDFTWTACVKMASKGAFDNDIIGKDSGGIGTGTTCEYDLRMDNAADDRFDFNVANGSSNGKVLANNLGSPAINTEYLIICWYDSGAQTLNIQVNNGTANSAAWTGGTQDGTGELNIGAVNSGLRTFDGLINRVGFWKRTLTSGERTELWNSGTPKTYPY